MCPEINSFCSPELHEIEQGVIIASVPMLDGCVQINNQQATQANR